MRTRRTRTAAALLALAALALSACGKKEEAAGSHTLTLAAAADIQSFDPLKTGAGNALQYLQPIYDSLTRINNDQTVGPSLAAAFEYTDPAKKVLKLTLREGVTFSDGTPLDAEAVRQNLTRDIKGPNAIVLAAIDKVTAAGPNVVQIDLKTADPALLYNLGLNAGMMVSPKVFADPNADPVGIGAYTLDRGQTTQGDHYTYVRNPKYHDAKAYPYEKIVIKSIPDTNARVAAIRTGQADAGTGTAAVISQAEGAGLTVSQQPGQVAGMWLVDREGKLAPELKDVRVRQAINHAIDAEGIRKSINGGLGARTTQMFYPGSPAYDPALDNTYPHDPAKAKQLLAEAGYPNGFALKLPSENVYLPALYPVLSQQLAAVGITAEYTPVAANQLSQQYFSGQYPAFMYMWGTSQNWVDASLLLSKDSPVNPFHVADPKVADLLARIAPADGEQQTALYKELNRYVVEQAWFAPLYQAGSVYLSGPKVKVTLQQGMAVPAISGYAPAG